MLFAFEVSNIRFSLHYMCNEREIKICEITVHEFHSFNFSRDRRYKDIGIIRYLFEAMAGIRDMSKAYPKPFSEKEALDELIDTALAYREFLNEKREES